MRPEVWKQEYTPRVLCNIPLGRKRRSRRLTALLGWFLLLLVITSVWRLYER